VSAVWNCVLEYLSTSAKNQKITAWSNFLSSETIAFSPVPIRTFTKRINPSDLFVNKFSRSLPNGCEAALHGGPPLLHNLFCRFR
jgi:hypothetical protein